MRAFHPTGGYLEDTRIEAVFEPADVEKYRALLSAPFAMPDHPMVWAYVMSFDKVAWPLTPYGEATVMLAVRLGKTAGWHAVTMPVTSRLARWGGRSLGGFPKELAEVQLAREDGDVTGIARQGDTTLLQMRLTDTTPAQSGSLELPGLSDGVPAFQLVPPGRGSKVVATTVDVVEEPFIEGVRGVVQLVADPRMPWAPLLPREAPGSSYVRKGLFILRFGRFAARNTLRTHGLAARAAGTLDVSTGSAVQ